MRKHLFLVLLVVVWGWPLMASAQQHLTAGPEQCLECHDDVISAEEFSNSVHAS